MIVLLRGIEWSGGEGEGRGNEPILEGKIASSSNIPCTQFIRQSTYSSHSQIPISTTRFESHKLKGEGRTRS